MFLKNIYRKFIKGKGQKDTPVGTDLELIPWSSVVEECYDKELSFAYPVVKVIYTDDRTKRVAILQKSDTVYTLFSQVLYPYEIDELKYISNGLHGFWHSNDLCMNSMFDSVESAEREIFSYPPFKTQKPPCTE